MFKASVMTEHKGDDLLATGAHHAWTGEPAGSVARAGKLGRERNWLERAQPSNPRHAAITRSLYSWSSYKSWTDKVRGSFEKEKK
jgi:hypothetical protein